MHTIVLLLLTLVTVSTPQDLPETTVIPYDFEPLQEEEEESARVTDRFDSDTEVDMPDIVDHPVFEHEEADIEDEMVTDNNTDSVNIVVKGGTGKGKKK